MRKHFDYLLIAVLVFLLAACGKSSTATWQAQYDLGMQYLTEGNNYSAAVLAFTAAIETEPKMAALYIARGDAYSAWAEETEALALAALSEGETLAWSDITVTGDDGNTYTLEELYENAISDYEEAIRLIESGEAVDDSPEELLEEANGKRQETESKLEESREEYEREWNEQRSSSDGTAAQEDGAEDSDGTGNADETGNADGTGNADETENADGTGTTEGTDDNLAIYQNYEDCSEEEQSVIVMLVNAAEDGDLDSLPLLKDIPEVTGYYFYNDYKIHITKVYSDDGYYEPLGIQNYRSYMTVSVRPQSGMGYVYYIYEYQNVGDLIKTGNLNYGYCTRETDYIACLCEDWNWNGEYTETYIYDKVTMYEYIGYETGSVSNTLLNGTISTTYTTSDAVYTWTSIYEDGIIVDRSGTVGKWTTQNAYSGGSGKIRKYFWLNEAYEPYDITRSYDSNDSLTYMSCSLNDELMWVREYRYDEEGNYLGYDEYYFDDNAFTG